MADGEIDPATRIRLLGSLLKQLEEEERLKQEKGKQNAQGEQPALPVVKAEASRDASQKAAGDGQEIGPAAGSQGPQKGKAPPGAGEIQPSPGGGQAATAGSPGKKALGTIVEETEPEEEEDSPPRPSPKKKGSAGENAKRKQGPPVPGRKETA